MEKYTEDIVTEKLNIPETDCLVLIGHSIEKGINNQWYLTGWLQAVEERGTSSDGFQKFIRTGKRQFVDEQTSNTIVGGGILATMAGAEIYKQLAEEGRPPKIISICSGRPAYLDKLAPDEPDITETKIIHCNLTKRLSRDHLFPKQVLKENGINTEDDVKNGLDSAVEENCKNVTFTALEIRLPRVKVFCDKLMSENSKYSNLKINYISTEKVMANLFAKKGLYKLWRELTKKFKESKGYKRTLDAETGGINALKAGKYGEALGGKGKT